MVTQGLREARTAHRNGFTAAREMGNDPRRKGPLFLFLRF
jgi:hypothetical protein